MQEILNQLNRVRGVGGSLLVSSDGLPMASALREGIDEAQLAAELEWLKAAIYGGRNATVHLEKMDAFVKYSSRSGTLSEQQL